MSMDKSLQDSDLFELRHKWKETRSNVRFYTVIFIIVMLFLLVGSFFTSNFGFVQVDGRSMVNTLWDGEYLLSYRMWSTKQLKRGDVIVVYVGDYPEIQAENAGKKELEKTKYLIKRLIALEGDIVRCEDGQISICYAGTYDENTPREEYVFEPLDESGYAYYDSYETKMHYDFKEEYVVESGEIFFLGDNRGNSLDSRYNEGYSHLDRLYKAKDVTAIVPDWAIKHQDVIRKLLLWNK